MFESTNGTNLRMATNKRIIKILFGFFVSVMTCFALVAQAAAPVIQGVQGLDRRTGDVYSNTEAVAGQFLVIYGTGFAASGTQVTINGSPATFSGPYDIPGQQQINVQLGANPTGTVDIVVVVGGVSSNTQTFRIVPATTQPPGGNPPVATGSSPGCNQLAQNFINFGGGTPGPLLNNCYTPGGAVARVVRLTFTLVAILAVLFIVIGGYRYMTSAGDEKRAGGGKKTILWAAIGLVLVLLAYTIVTVVTRLTTTTQLF